MVAYGNCKQVHNHFPILHTKALGIALGRMRATVTGMEGVQEEAREEPVCVVRTAGGFNAEKESREETG